jgi:molybdopterin-binding protein
VVNLDCDRDVEACFGGEGEVISLITRASADELGMAPGLRVSASVKATALNMLAG